MQKGIDDGTSDTLQVDKEPAAEGVSSLMKETTSEGVCDIQMSDRKFIQIDSSITHTFLSIELTDVDVGNNHGIELTTIEHRGAR
jgi:hypothetical protein